MSTRPEAETSKLVLDVDTGIDDALALILALRAPQSRVLGIGTVAGNTEVERATVNTLKVLEIVGADIPVAMGATKGLVRPLATVPYIHGQDGMGDADYPAPRLQASGEFAPDQISRLAREHPGEITLIPLGPLTNIATALVRDPELPRYIKNVVVMAGAIAVPGNVTAVAEANVWHDPEAAKIVFAADWPMTMVALDVTMETFLRPAQWERLNASGGQVARFAVAISQFYYNSYSTLLGQEGCALHDPLAVGIALDPTLVTGAVDLDVEVEDKAGVTLGMTVGDRRALLGPGYARPEHPIRVPTAVDEERFVTMFMSALLA